MMNLDKKKITILAVSYFSSNHLKRLFSNLIEKANNQEKLQFLIVDNSCGEDRKLYVDFNNSPNVNIICNNEKTRQRSKSHAMGLDLGLKSIKTKYTLIVDPDIHIFECNWDTFCTSQLEKDPKTILGAPYPQWKIGKVHKYPSVVFMFFQTELIKKMKKLFSPFPSFSERIYNSIVRKIIRLGGVANKHILNKFHLLRKLCFILEKSTGITSPDTGMEIINECVANKFRTVIFESPYQADFIKDGKLEYAAIAKDFELFTYRNRPIMTHMYSSGVFYWKTKKSGNLQYWKSLIKAVENKIRRNL